MSELQTPNDDDARVMTPNQAQIACCVESYIIKNWREGVRIGESNLDSHQTKIFATYPHAHYAQLQILDKGIGEDALRDVDSAILTGCIEAWEYIHDVEEASNV